MAQRSPAPVLPAMPAAKTTPQGLGGLGGLFPAASPAKAFRMGLGGSGLLPAQPRGCSAQIVSPTPSSDCSVERGERGGWRGGEQWESWHLSPVPPPGAHHRPPRWLPILSLLLRDLHSVSIQVAGLDPQDRSWQDPTSPKLPPASLPHRASLHPPQSSACPLTATKHALPPAHSRRGAVPRTRPDASRPTASRCAWHPRRRRENRW